MNLLLKKYAVLIIAGGVALLLLIIVSLGLISAWGHYRQEKEALQSVLGRLDELAVQRDPYPSAENIRREADNANDLLDQYNELNTLMRAGQVEPQAMEAADFMTLLENTLRRLRERLDEARVKYPDKFGFGFDRYAVGLQPAPNTIPRLVQQLRIMDRLFQALAQAPILELVSINREEFEIAAAEPAARRPRGGGETPPVLGSEPLFTSQRFKLVLRAQDAAVFDLLNRLARMPMFVTVASLEMSNTKQSAKETEGGGKETAVREGPGAAPAERRVVLGKEPVDVKLDVDVYQFAPPIPVAEGRRKQ